MLKDIRLDGQLVLPLSTNLLDIVILHIVLKAILNYVAIIDELVTLGNCYASVSSSLKSVLADTITTFIEFLIWIGAGLALPDASDWGSTILTSRAGLA